MPVDWEEISRLFQRAMRNAQDAGVRVSISGNFMLEPAGVVAAYDELYSVYSEIRGKREAVVAKAGDARNFCGMIYGVDSSYEQMRGLVASQDSPYVLHLRAAEDSVAALLNAIHDSAAASQRADEESAVVLRQSAAGAEG